MEKKRYLLFFVGLIILLNIVYAQNELESFDEEREIPIIPPPPPTGEEAGKFDVLLELKEYKTKDLISDIHIEAGLYNEGTGEEIKTLKYVSENGILSLQLYPAHWTIKLKVDKLESDGKDYFFERELNVDKTINETIYLLPVGSIRGVVYENNKALKSALIRFDCSGNYGEKDEIKTNNFGSFTSYWLPVGSCKISAVYGNKLGYENVLIKHGQLNDVEITLTKSIFSGYSLSYFILILIIVSIVFSISYFYIFKKKISKKEEKEGQPEKGLSERTKDIIKTLKEKEKKVVEFLLENKNNSTQSKIKNELGIPKTTLARLLQGLDLKKIVKIEKIGKLKKVQLTEWFLGKEEMDHT